MLTEFGRLPVYAGWRLAVYVRVVAHLDGADDRVVERGDVFVGNHLWVIYQFVRGLHPRVDEVPRRAEVRVPLRGCPGHELLVHNPDQFLAVLGPCLHRCVLRMLHNLRQAQRGHERLPVAVRLQVHELDPTFILAFVQIGEHVPGRLAVVGPEPVAAHYQAHTHAHALEPHIRAQVRGVHLLADSLQVSCHQRRQDALAQHDRAHLVGHALRHTHRLIGSGGSRGDHQAAARLPAAVERRQRRVRPVRTIPRSRAVYDHRIDLFQRLIAHVQPLRDALPVILYEHVRRLDQFVDDLAALGRLEIDSDAALVAVVRLEVGVATSGQGGGESRSSCHRAARVSVQRLYLDYVRTHVAHHSRGHRAELPHSPVQHPYALQWSGNSACAILVHLPPPLAGCIVCGRFWRF